MKDKVSRREYYFLQQDYTTARFIVPYIEKYKKVDSSIRVLEIACGEAGNLKFFVDLGCEVVGVDYNDDKIEKGKIYLKKHTKDVLKLKLISSNIYDVNPANIGLFDVIILRDAIEHIPNQANFIKFLHQFIKKDGVVFFGFPPWYMPFGGHQQGCKSFLKKVPYFHLLPKPLYKAVLQLFGESP
ncbi:MAG: SAM-dependent methyltransferase, partial [Flavobacteriales bacterium]|nr:SAM-dependent methyltransferase [Flavobacteriales bacterium]